MLSFLEKHRKSLFGYAVSSLFVLFVLFVFPFHAIGSSTIWDGVSSTPPSRGSGTDADPYVICTAADLAGMRDWVNAGVNTTAVFSLASDIDLGETSGCP